MFAKCLYFLCVLLRGQVGWVVQYFHVYGLSGARGKVITRSFKSFVYKFSYVKPVSIKVPQVLKYSSEVSQKPHFS